MNFWVDLLKQNTQMFFNWWMDKQTTEHLYNEIQLGIKEKWTTDKCNNVEESQKPLCRMKETSLEKIKHHAIPLKYQSWKDKNYSDKEQVRGCQKL